MKRRRSIDGIWCGRQDETYLCVSKVNGNAWYIVVFGYEFWIGPGKPSFVGTVRDRWKNGKGSRDRSTKTLSSNVSSNRIINRLWIKSIALKSTIFTKLQKIRREQK